MSQSIQYRPDVDGLRTIAIIPVIIFHMHANWLAGGFVGVDVFFVISGYLITSLLLRKMLLKEFSFADFYIRRARRLLPAAFAMYVVVALAFLFAYPPPYFEKVSQGIFFSALFVSNIYFWKQGGYFSENLELNPLLHTWSLSVEEQYYFVVPLLIFLTLKWFRFSWLVALLVTATLVSLAIAIQYPSNSESYASFYLLVTRFYEMSIGGIVAALHNRGIKTESHSGWLRLLGLCIVFYAIFMFSGDMAYPSYHALVPVLGTALILFASSNKGVLYAVLSSRLFVSIGLISYSLYLWHWPIIVFVKWFYELTFMTVAWAVLAIFSFAIASFYTIEKPFRTGALKKPKTALPTLGVSWCVIVISVFTVVDTLNVKVSDPDGELSKTHLRAVKAESTRNQCTNQIRKFGTMQFCVVDNQPVEKPLRVFIWGDSHGSALSHAYHAMPSDYLVHFTNNTGCPPLPNVERIGNSHNCGFEAKTIIAHLLKEQYDKVILVGAYNNYLNWDIVTDAQKKKSSVDAIRAGLVELTNTLGTEEIYFVPQGPRFDRDVPEHYMRVKGKNANEEIYVDKETYNSQQQQMLQLIDTKQITVLELEDVYCRGHSCPGTKQGVLLYKDSHHVSNDFSYELIEAIVSQL